jgi:hypothetical protein
MTHYGKNVCCKSSMTMQLLVASIAIEEKKIVHSSTLESRGVRVEKRQQN